MKHRKFLAYGIMCLAMTVAASINASAQGTVTDSLTGLMWEQADNRQWLNWYDACTYCDELTLGGHSDWRLPEMAELRTIADYTTIDMALEPLYKGYSAFKSQIYWSNTEYVGYGQPPLIYSWGVSFYAGASQPRYKINHHSVRCVRGDMFVPFDPVVETAGVLRDTVSNLLWQNNEVLVQDWESASQYCENLTLGGYADWRLPNIDELQSIIDYETFRPAVHEIFRGNTPNSTFWSKTPYAKSAFHYWGVNFENGTVSGNSQQNRKETANCVRCVQGDEIIVEPSELECDPGVYSSLAVTLLNALTGTAVAGFPVEVEGQTVNTNTSGTAEFALLRRPSTVVHVIRDGYVEVNQEIAIVCGAPNTVTIAILPLDAGAQRGDIRFILTWGAQPPDLDSHMTGPEAGGGNFHVYYANRTSADARVTLDVDDTSSYGPETITVQKANDAYTPGDYLYYIYNFSRSPSITSQRQYISAVVYQGAEMIGVFQPPRSEDQDVGVTWNVVSMNISAAGVVSFSVASTAGAPRLDPTPHEYDYGIVYMEDNQLNSGIINVANLGTGNLFINSMRMSDSTNFSLQSSSGSFSPTIGPGSVSSVSVFFNPRRTGLFQDYLTIRSDDPYTPTRMIPITANVMSNLTTVPTTQTMLVGSTVTFRITGGTPPYSVYSPTSSAQVSLVKSGPDETFPSTVEVTSTAIGYGPLTISDSNSNSVQAWVNMVQSLPIWAYFTATPTFGYDAPMSVQFANQSVSETAISSYAWDFGDGGTSSMENPSHSYAAAGSYSVSLTVTSASGSDTLTRTNYVTVFVRGDLNCDGNVDLSDAVLAMDEQLYDNFLQTICSNDYDGDNKIGLGEVLFILQKVAGIR